MTNPQLDLKKIKYKDSVSLIDIEHMCRGIIERHKDTIGVKKHSIAVPRLRRILEAALELSNSGGFHAMTLRDLADASGMSTGGLYAYFDCKTTLLKMILTEVTFVVDQVLSDPPPEVAGDHVARLRWMIDAHLRLTEALLPWFTFAFMEAKNFPTEERRLAINSEALTEKHFADAIAAGVEAGQLRRDTSDLLAPIIKALVQDWYVKRAKYRYKQVALETYSATVQDVVLRSCLPTVDFR